MAHPIDEQIKKLTVVDVLRTLGDNSPLCCAIGCEDKCEGCPMDVDFREAARYAISVLDPPKPKTTTINGVEFTEEEIEKMRKLFA